MFASDPDPAAEPQWKEPAPETSAAGAGPSTMPPLLVNTGSAKPHRLWRHIPMDRPIFTPAILAVLVAIFLLMTALGGSLTATQDPQYLADWGAKVNFMVYQGDWWRLITSTFLHAGFIHLALNGYALYLIGNDVEGFFGHGRFLAIYAISGLAGSVASFIFSPLDVATVGASGAIFGLVGALGVYFWQHKRMFGRLGNLQFWNIIVVIALNLGLGLSGLFPIDNSAHVGGLLAGAAVGYALCPQYEMAQWAMPGTWTVRKSGDARTAWLLAGLIGLLVVGVFFLALWLVQIGVIPMQ